MNETKTLIETHSASNPEIFQHQYFASTSISLIEVQAQLLVNQDLLKTLLIQQGVSQESLNAQSEAALDSYREALTRKFGEGLAEYKEALIAALNASPNNNQ